MPRTTQSKREREKRVVALMVDLYCRKHHATHRVDGGPCPECADLVAYAQARSDRCPFMDEKTFCSNCRVHCYKPAMRERVRQVMRYAGPRMLWYHPVLAVRHLVETRREQRRLGSKDAR